MTHDPRKALADELKPCPFCGANAMSANSEDGEIMVLCSDEQCKAQPWVCGLNKEEAAHRWIKSISEDDLASEIFVTAEQSPKFKGPICCYCDNVLSCAHCGREQPDDSALPAAEQRAELIPLADHDDIGRKVLNQPWAIQSAIVTIAAHCRVLLDKYPTGDAADLAGCISQDCLELTNALPAPVNREPTEKQLNAARDWSRDKYGKPIGNEAAMGCWQTMFDALTPPERGE